MISHLNHITASFKTSTLRDNICDLLTDAILSGKLHPGERLNESELARQLRVSRAPIREALQQLQAQGLVVNQPRRGMFVVSLDEEEVQKINSLRLVLEAEALRLCRLRLTPQNARRLQQVIEKLERSGTGTSAIEAIRLDLEFHRLLWSFSGNEYLEKMLTSLTAPLFAYAVLTKPKSEKMKMILDSHRPLLDYALGRSDRSADEVIHAHLTLRWNGPDRFASRWLEASPINETGS
jgi:DNA-binding GntR family transcriptional regulator